MSRTDEQVVQVRPYIDPRRAGDAQRYEQKLAKAVERAREAAVEASLRRFAQEAS